MKNVVLELQYTFHLQIKIRKNLIESGLLVIIAIMHENAFIKHYITDQNIATGETSPAITPYHTYHSLSHLSLL